MGGVLLNLICRSRSFSSRSLDGSRPFRSDSLSHPPKRVAVIGGGLAGLATVFHLIDRDPRIEITVFDTAAVGTGGASSVAGG
jgi:NADPH-dependent 2,4-dienoyl-CoA reductase/sulfur reductase-like enzyme